MYKKKILSAILATTIFSSMFIFSGCNKEENPDPLEPMIYHSIPVKNDNMLARNSIADVAIRYFYLINNGKYELANELIDRTDLSICTPDILEELYKNVLNFELNENNRVVSVSVNGNRASVTFINLNDTAESWDPKYDEDENPAPSWFKSPDPYVTAPDYANTYEIEDVNDDGYIDETDMQWEDHPELNPDYEPEYDEDYEDDDDVNTTATGAGTVTYKTTASSAKSETSGESKKTEESKKEGSKESSKADGNKSDSSKSSEGSKDINDIGGVKDKETSKIEESKDKEDKADGNKEESDVHVNTKDVLPDKLHESEELIGYKTYTMDIYVTPYKSGFKVKLPSSMTTNTRLMIKVPDDMRIKVGDLELNKSMMNLDDFYVIDKLPKVEKFTVELDNLMLGHSEKEIDLTKRVYYIYSNLVPTHELKEQVMSYIKPALQQYYDDLFAGVKFENSSFLKDYMYKSGELQTVKYMYDKFQLEHLNHDEEDKVVTTYSIRKIRFPLNTEDSSDELNSSDFRVTSYYYVEVPVYITIDINTKEYGEKTLESTEIGGIIKLTKDSDGKLYVWELDEALALLDY